MKNKISFLVLFGATMISTLSSCSDNSVYDGPDTPGSKLQVYAEIQQQQTRVSGTAWDKNDAIGIHDGKMINNVNVEYVADGKGKFSPVKNDIYVLGSDKTTFNAYYPYNNEVTADAPAITFDASTDVNVDFLWATASASREEPTLRLQFAHKMSKLLFNVTGFEEQTGRNMTVTLKGIEVAGTFDTTKGSIVTNTAKGNITTKGVVGTPVSFILPPKSTGTKADSGNEVSIIIEVEGVAYQGVFTPTLSASTQMTFSIDLSVTDEKNNVTIESGTITDWAKKDCGQIVVEEESGEDKLEVGDFYLADGTIVDRRATLSAEQKAQVVGVVFYVGNPQVSALYGETSANDILLKDHPDCTHGLVLSREAYPAKGAHWIDQELAGGAGLMFQWFTDNNIAGVYGSRYAVVDGEVSASKADSKGENYFLGYNNTSLWKQFATAKSLGEEFVGLTQLNEFAKANPLPKSTSGWYVPSLGEMKTLCPLVDADAKTYKVVSTLTSSFNKLGDEAFLQKNRYWTSTEGRISSDKASTMAITFLKGGAWTQSFSPTVNATTGWFHFAFAF